VLNYTLGKQDAELIGGNLAGLTPRELAAEFGAARRMNPHLGKAVHHVSLSAAPGERLTNEQWGRVADGYREKMGFGNTQFVLIRHVDQDHDHVHLIQSRIRLDGATVSDSQDYKRQEVAMREIERQFGLASGERQSTRRAPTVGELRKAERTGQVPPRLLIQEAAKAAKAEAKSVDGFIAGMAARGVEVERTASGGLIFKQGGLSFKASAVDRSLSAAQLAKFWEKDHGHDGEVDRRGKQGSERSTETAGAGARSPGGASRNRGTEGEGGILNKERAQGDRPPGVESRESRTTSQGGTDRRRRGINSSPNRSNRSSDMTNATSLKPGKRRATQSVIRDNFSDVISTDDRGELLTGSRLSALHQLKHLHDLQAIEDRPARQALLFMDGERLTSDASGIHHKAGEFTAKTADRMMAVAKERGWESVQFYGSLEAKMLLCEAAERAGLPVENPPLAWLKKKQEEEQQREAARRAAAREQREQEAREEEERRPDIIPDEGEDEQQRAETEMETEK
jgi:hypothetical protein